ncbi:MAG: T9SS type A sorting domain-containing protein [Saprospiraceae bacterium]|nr:T9SS type A sorting domain-containing protein [Saprospiraceae bacterium]
MDGITWQVLDTVIFPKANASGFYEGFEGPDFGAVSARFVLITALSNYGAPCTGLGELKINVLNSPLPVELLSFSGKCESIHVKLNWATETEKNSDFFEIENSEDAKDWTNVAKVSAAGESLKRKEYHFDIKNSDNGSGYYRLKMVDLDGKYTYSPIIFTDCASKTDGFSIYPNPAKEYITVFRNTSKNELINYSILDNFGRIIETGVISEKNEINIGQLHSGKYFLQLVVDGTPISKEFMKI